MNPSSHLHSWPRWWGLLILLSVLLLGGCGHSYTSYSLENLATAPLDAEQKQAHLTALSGIGVGGRSPGELKRAAAVLRSCSDAAPTTLPAFAAQTAVVARLFYGDRSPTDAFAAREWLTPELSAQLAVVFQQSHQRLLTQPPDLATVMVWTRTGIVLDRASEFETMILRSQNDPRLTCLMRADTVTRYALCDYARSIERAGGRYNLAQHILYEPSTPADELGDAAADAVAFAAFMPLHLASYAIYGQAFRLN